MTKTTIILLILLSVSIFSNAQSGRKIAPTPTPEIKNNNDSASYSESKPRANNPNRIIPTFRGGIVSQNQIPAPNQTGEKIDDSDDEVIRVETNLVTIPVSVLNNRGLYISDLTKENFKIFEDGIEQEIEYFGTFEQPFTVVLLIDTSPSADRVLPDIKQAAIAFVNQLKPQDSVIVIEFAGNISVLTEATNDRQQIYRAINRADIGNGTVLYDAINFSLRKRLNRIEGRKAIVLLSDGVDTMSGSSYDKSLAEAEKSDTLVFSVYYNTLGDTLRSVDIFQTRTRQQVLNDYRLGKQYMQELADFTGGRFFEARTSNLSLNEAFAGIAEELRRQYVIGYYSTSPGQTGQRKQVKVRVNRPNLIVRARDSYVVGQK